jgi:hypothetical protein
MSYEELAVSQQAGLVMQARDRLYRGKRENTTVFFAMYYFWFLRIRSSLVNTVLIANAPVATVLGSVGTVESEGRQMKQC